MIARTKIHFTDNPAVSDQPGKYISLALDTEKVLRSYKHSLFSFEWLRPDGTIKEAAELPPQERNKRNEIEDRLAAGKPIAKPVLGIGLMENIEIGIGRAEFLALAACGVKTVEVHVPKFGESDFKDFLSQVG